MKRYEDSDYFNYDKYRAQEWKREHDAGGFKCSHCKQFVVINDIMGTVNRNHCSWCLWSRHVDEVKVRLVKLCSFTFVRYVKKSQLTA